MGWVSWSLPPDGARLGKQWVGCSVVSSAGKLGLGGAAVKVGAGLGAWGSTGGSAGDVGGYRGC